MTALSADEQAMIAAITAAELQDQCENDCALALALSQNGEAGLYQENLVPPDFDEASQLEILAGIDQGVLAESVDPRWRHCYVCGRRTLNPHKPKEHPDCPHGSCGLQCHVKLCDMWMNMKAEFEEWDAEFNSLSSCKRRRLER